MQDHVFTTMLSVYVTVMGQSKGLLIMPMLETQSPYHRARTAKP